MQDVIRAFWQNRVGAVSQVRGHSGAGTNRRLKLRGSRSRMTNGYRHAGAGGVFDERRRSRRLGGERQQADQTLRGLL